MRRATTGDPDESTPTKFLKFMYTAREAQYIVDKHIRNSGRRSSLNNYKVKVLQKEIHERHYTPVQVVERHPKLFKNSALIYTWINRKKIPNVSYYDLPMQGKRFKRSINKNFIKDQRAKSQKRKLAELYSINDRPDSINDRSEFGHWEMDGVEGKKVGSKALLITLVERKTRFQVAVKAKSKSALDVLSALESVNERFGKYIKSITCDNGHEFTNSIVTGFVLNNFGSLYIANSYAPYERGTNERTNRNLRAPWYFPKGTSFGNVTQERIDEVTSEINEKPLTHVFSHGRSPIREFRKHIRKINLQLN
ncbi:IS30 family transposase [Weissella muntiaci]|uniref:IS30 family transposase n=1 Tax=Weissella muntiaci TaxID=2508881 RepID=UPI001FE64635|nr:IS30 family transposase [Weissella muntiaci]